MDYDDILEGSDSKSIGSLSQRLFESDNEEDDDENEKYFGTCNGYSSQPGSKSNLLLCSECDLKCRSCSYRPQTPSAFGRFVEEKLDHPQISDPCSCESPSDDQETRRDKDNREETSDGCSSCQQYSFNGTRRCIHCDTSDPDESDLICFRCQNDVGTQCEKCEREGKFKGIYSVTASSSDDSKRMTKIRLNSKSIEFDSDETVESDPTNGLDEEIVAERLETIAEAKGDTASENGEDENPRKLNGSSSQAKFLNYMIVIFL